MGQYGIGQMRRCRLQLGRGRTCQMLYVLYLIYAIASIVVIYSSLQIYIKMNTGEDGVKKEIMMVVGACLFLIGASIVFPAFFGYRI